MNISIFLYIDTSVLIGGKRTSSLPKDPILRRVIEHKDAGEIKILNSDILREELKNNVQEYEESAKRFIDFEDLKPIIDRFVQLICVLYEGSFLLDLSQDGEEIAQIVKSNYAGEAPFSKKKTNEFKDAFTINAIKKFIKINSNKNCKYIICTEDKRFSDSFFNHDVIVVNKIGDCLAECNFFINAPSLNEELYPILSEKIPPMFKLNSDYFFDVLDCRDSIFSYDFFLNDCEVDYQDVSWNSNLIEIESIIDVKIEKSDFRVIFRLCLHGLVDGSFSFYSPDEDIFLDEIYRSCPEESIGINYRYSDSKLIANVEAEVLINKKTRDLVENSIKILSASIEIGLPRYISGGNMSCSFEED